VGWALRFTGRLGGMLKSAVSPWIAHAAQAG
jgi:hypothetical protein